MCPFLCFRFELRRNYLYVNNQGIICFYAKVYAENNAEFMGKDSGAIDLGNSISSILYDVPKTLATFTRIGSR